MNLQDLLPKDAHKKRRNEVVALNSKWGRTGLLEGLDEHNTGVVSQLLENQAKQLVTEANRTGTAAGSEEWAGVALPLIRRIFGEITAKDFVSVQPMNLPSGLVFWLEFKYGTGQPGFTTGAGVDSQSDSIWGVSDAKKGTVATGGLYGEGRFGYTINDYSSSALLMATGETPGAATASMAAANNTTDINFDSDFSASVDASDLYKVTVSVDSLTNPDLLGARAWTLSSANIETQFNQFTQVSSDDSLVTFLVSGSGADISDLVVYYHKQPTDTTRGDFEETKTQEEPLDIPELNLEFHSQALTAKTRKLKAMWTPEFAQDINAYQNVDAEAELTGILGEYVSREIDLEILDMLRVSAQSTDFWSARLGFQYDAVSQTFAQTSANASAYNQGTWFQTIGTKIQKMSNTIDQLTFRGGANFIVTNPTVATVLESIPGYAADTDGSKHQFGMGTRKIGMVNNTYQVYKCPYMKENVMLVGYRGSNYLETGAVYAPYIPLIMTPLVHDPDNFTPRKAVMTRYAKEMLRPEFYGKIFVEGLDTI
tara:strand:+ start:713 stop:2332 length:1620 start_codon:yes stop_codon:yes gene_type:complete